jgi:hypothetical protein
MSSGTSTAGAKFAAIYSGAQERVGEVPAKKERLEHIASPRPSHPWQSSQVQKTYRELALEQPTEEARALLWSKASGQSAAWIYGLSQRLPDSDFDQAVRLHLSLTSIPQAVDNVLACNRCHHKIHGKREPSFVTHTGIHGIN